MGIINFVGNGLFRGSVCAAGFLGAQEGARQATAGLVHHWSSAQVSAFLGKDVACSVTIPAKFSAAVAYISAHTPTLATLVAAIKTGLITGGLVITLLYFINWLGGERGIPPHVKEVVDELRICGDVTLLLPVGNVDYLLRAAIVDQPVIPGAVPISLAAHDDRLATISNQIGVLQGSAPALHTAMVNDLGQMRRALNQRNVIKVADNSQPGFERLMHEFAPEFCYQRFTYRQPHPEVALVRKVGLVFIAAECARKNLPIVMVGASPHQVSSFPNVVHNHAPSSSGRDNYRHNHSGTAVNRAFADAVACRTKLQHCVHAFPETTLVLPFSAQDIDIEVVIRSMAMNGQTDAYVIMHLPIPFLDPRINTWVDDQLGVRFERRGGKIRMYHIEDASAGYVNDEKAMMSWARSTPVLPGYHSMVEELRSVGSIYLLHLTVTPGDREEHVTHWKVGKEDFYILPVLKPDWVFHKDEDRHYVVPARRFDNVVGFCSSTGVARNTPEMVANKIRGQQAEIKIANQVLLPRWSLTPDQFNSTITHALLKAHMMRHDHEITFKQGYAYIESWYDTMEGSFSKRLWMHIKHLATLSNLWEHPRMFDQKLKRWLCDKLLSAHWHFGRMENPYGEHGSYRVRHSPYCLTRQEFKENVLVTPELGPPVSIATTNFALYRCSGTERRERRLIKEHGLFAQVHSDLIQGNTKRQPRRNQTPFPDGLWSGKKALQLAELFHPPVEMGDSWRQLPSLRAAYLACMLEKMPREDEDEAIENAEGEDGNTTVTSGGSVCEAGEGEGEAESLASGGKVEVTREDSLAQEAPETSIIVPKSESNPRTEEALSTSIESEETVSEILEAGNGLLNTKEPVTWYQVGPELTSVPVFHSGKVVFEGHISFEDGPNPTPSQREFSSNFASKAEILAHFNKSNHANPIPAPDRGTLELVKLILDNSGVKHTNYDKIDYQSMIDRAGFSERDTEDENALRDLVRSFWERVAEEQLTDERNYRRKIGVILKGIPASAKSTLARAVIKGERTLVVVPSQKLRSEWSAEVNTNLVEVVTQHRIPQGERYDYMIIDEVNLLGEDLVEAWCYLARKLRVKRLLALGDPFQGNQGKRGSADFGKGALAAPTIELRNAFSLPQDALQCFLAINGLLHSDQYRTLSPVKRSVYGLDREIADSTEFPGLDLYTRSRVHSEDLVDPHGRAIISVTQSQGTRARRHYFTTGLPHHKKKWFQSMLATQSVLFTRHTDKLFLDVPHHIAQESFPALRFEVAPVINGKSLSKMMLERPRRPGHLDQVMLPFSDLGDILTHAALPLDFSLHGGERLVHITPDVDRPELEKGDMTTDFPSIAMAQEVLNPRVDVPSRRDYKEELDFTASSVHGLRTIGELGWGEDPVMRCQIPGVFNLGDIQMARDRYNDLRNMCLRQLNEPKGVTITSLDISDANLMWSLYRQAFMKGEVNVHVTGHFGYDYLSTRTQAYLDSWNDPFGESNHTLVRSAFLKTQVKVKPGLAGQETHGQTVIANGASMTNTFAPWARNGYYYMSCTDRDDCITDTGFSDEDLSIELLERGIGARIESNGNLQIDLTRQDSTHRPAHVIAYCLFLEAAGVPPEITELYLRLRSVMYVKSLAENLYAAEARWNLGSGDPFTLNANCFMMKCNIAVEYDNISACACIQKGDDFIASNEGWRLSNRHEMRQRLRYTMKVDVNKPAYHAGRFLYQGQLLGDPVRAFMRHYSKTYDSGVSDGELYRSFIDRPLQFTEAQNEYLKVAIPLFYPDISGEEASIILDTIRSLHSFKNFRSTYKGATEIRGKIFDPTLDCAFKVISLLRPDLNNKNKRQFRGLQDPKQLAALFERYNVPVTLASHPAFVEPAFRGAVISQNHVFAVLD